MKQEQNIATNNLIPIDTRSKEFELLMTIYKKASEQVYNELIILKDKLNELYGYDVINNITVRLKSQNSIINKMEKKKYNLNYRNLVENINDVAGIRVVCPLKNHIYTLIDRISELENIKIIKEKDYITKPKKSGYSGYHLIVQTPVEVDGRKVSIKVEIQLRTMAMDFWATNEHKIKYKTNQKISTLDSKRLALYAKILSFIDDKMMKIYRKNELSYKR